MATILLTGATGMIGSALGKKLAKEGHQLIIVSRSHPEVAISKIPFCCHGALQADLTKTPIDSPLLSEVEYVIHLAGESVANQRWTHDYKQKLIDSRVETTKNLRRSFEKLNNSQLKGYLGASAIGYYPSSLEESFDENSQPGNGFLSKLVTAWEKEHTKWSELPQSPLVSIVRIGIVHGYPGGVLGEVVPLFKSHFGSALGSGEQWMSWIDLLDLCEVFSWLIKKESWSPVYNAVAPHPVTNLVWSKSLAGSLGVKLLPNAPSIALKLALGERASILLDSHKIKPLNLEKEGFVFKRPTLQSSFQEVKEFFQNATHVFIAEQFVPRALEEVFSFFCQAKNLEKISPHFLKFQVKTQSTTHIQEGTVIDYRLKVRGVPVRWRSKIVNWNPPYEFSDLQELGPYKYWFHTHSFEALPGGTLIRDLVRYKLPLAPLSDWVAQKFVKSEIQEIFHYRQKVLRELFRK